PVQPQRGSRGRDAPAMPGGQGVVDGERTGLAGPVLDGGHHLAGLIGQVQGAQVGDGGQRGETVGKIHGCCGRLSWSEKPLKPLKSRGRMAPIQMAWSRWSRRALPVFGWMKTVSPP